MDNKKRVDDILKELMSDYKKNVGQLYPNSNNECKVYKKHETAVEKVLSGERPFGIAFTLFNYFSDWHLQYSQYLALYLHDGHKAQTEFAASSLYGYLHVKSADISFGCWVSNIFVLMDKVSLYMAQNILCGWWDKAYEIADIMIASIDFGIVNNQENEKVKRLIGCGQNDIPASWFLLELYCKINYKEFNRDNADYPESMVPYNQVVEKWDTRDLVEVDKLVYLMGDTHLAGAKEPTDDNDEYSEFEDSNTWLFPYEILTWLAYRTKAGLPNPTEFSHPLMNTPLARMFLELKTPLAKPKELPYAKELLAKLKEACPQIKVEM